MTLLIQRAVLSKASCFLAFAPRRSAAAVAARSFHGARMGLLPASGSANAAAAAGEPEGRGSEGHYFLSMLRQTNPDPAMARLPPLPPNDAIKFTEGPPSVVDLSPSTGPSASATHWLRLLNRAEDWAQGKGPDPLFDPKAKQNAASEQ